MSLFERILEARGIKGDIRSVFLSPDYSYGHDPFLLPDMHEAVDRLALARERQEHVTIYGDYDIDGLTSATLLVDAFRDFGFKNVDVFIPNRFVEGYGMTAEAVEKIVAGGANLIVTVDCGSLSEKEIVSANELGVDVIVTDHHNVADKQPPAVAVINPKRSDSKYPFCDLASVGVAFKLVQALQTRLDGLPAGQEKWLLDLVALGTVCDIVTLVDENRINVYWGMKVLSKTRRPGLRALMAVSNVDLSSINARALGFALGPRMNAAGRLETAQYALDMLTSDDPGTAMDRARYLDELNILRRADQDRIYREALLQAESYAGDPVLVLSGKDWNHGIVGIVASKILEKYKKPTFVLQEMGSETKGSARSYGEFSVAAAIRACEDLVMKGGGHKYAAGVTLLTENIDTFRKQVNAFYSGLYQIESQRQLLLPQADAIAGLDELTEDFLELVGKLEPFGNGNPEPVLRSDDLRVVNVRKMGSHAQHIKLELQDGSLRRMQFLAFNAPENYDVGLGKIVSVWYHPCLNEWQGRRSVEGRLLHLEASQE